jgi:hypothetical protein
VKETQEFKVATNLSITSFHFHHHKKDLFEQEFEKFEVLFKQAIKIFSS